MNKISLVIFFVIKNLSKLLQFFFKKNFLPYLYLHLRRNFIYIYILRKKIFFFTPSPILQWRVETFYTKEPDTLKWIDNFKNNSKNVFWDIGANIGLYSIYCSIKKKKLNIYSFEPSFLNLFPLSKNISINNLDNQVKIIQIPLHNKNKSFFKFFESSEIEGGALNSFQSKKKNSSKNKFSIFGLRADYLIKNNYLKKPNYIKIDVDGNEDLILEGFGKYLTNKSLYEILIEIDENKIKQKKKILSILKKSGYICYKKVNNNFNNEIIENTFNYFFKRK
jgi:FkbM family methyltransferase